MYTYIIGTVLGLLGIGVVISKLIKGSNAEALNANLDVKSNIIDIEKFIAKDKGLLDVEKAKRDQLVADLKAKQESNTSKDDLLNFVNKDDK